MVEAVKRGRFIRYEPTYFRQMTAWSECFLDVTQQGSQIKRDTRSYKHTSYSHFK